MLTFHMQQAIGRGDEWQAILSTDRCTKRIKIQIIAKGRDRCGHKHHGKR